MCVFSPLIFVLIEAYVCIGIARSRCVACTCRAPFYLRCMLLLLVGIFAVVYSHRMQNELDEVTARLAHVNLELPALTVVSPSVDANAVSVRTDTISFS